MQNNKQAMALSIKIDDIEFTCNEKYISEDRIYVLLTSKLANTQSDEFVIYKSNSQGLWRFFTCQISKSKFSIGGSKCPDKWDDYTVTTVIDFRLQTYVNSILDQLKLVEHEKKKTDTTKISYYKSDLPTTNSENVKETMANRHVFVPEFEVIYNYFNEIANEVTKHELMQPLKKTNLANMTTLQIDKVNTAKNNMLLIMNLMYEEIKVLNRYQVLKLVSEFIKNSFSIRTNPKDISMFKKELFKFDNAHIKLCDVEYGELAYKFTCNNNKSKNDAELYPYADDVLIYKIDIKHNSTDDVYTLYYMKYKIVNDNDIYYMPVLITPINTKINKYGLPTKYVRTGIYCNKPWDYIKQSFFKSTIKQAKQIIRKADNYVFIGQNYKTIWPFNLPIITGLAGKIVSTQNNYKIIKPANTINFIIY